MNGFGWVLDFFGSGRTGAVSGCMPALIAIRACGSGGGGARCRYGMGGCASNADFRLFT